MGLLGSKMSLMKSERFNGIGLICDALWTDFDNDGWLDLILAGEWAEIKFLKK